MNGIGKSTCRRCIVLAALAQLTALVACGDGGPAEVTTPAPPVPTSVTVVPSTATLAALGQTVQLNATVLDRSRQPIPGVSVTWTSSDESVATVDATGLVAATGNGATSITAAVTGTSVSGSAQVTVAQQPSEIALSPEQQSFRALGDTVRLTARVLDANGHVVEDAALDWVSTDPSVVSVDDAGLVTAVGEGSASVLATSGPAEGSADFSVEQQVAAVQLSPTPDTLRALGTTVQLTATGLDANGHATAATGFVWTSADAAVATVGDTGLVTAVGNGSTAITAALPDGDASASVGVTVAQQAETVRIAETVDTLDAGDQYQLSAAAYDGNQHLVPDARFEWSSSDESVAAVDPNGLVSAQDAGSVEITASVVGSDAAATIKLLVRASSAERERDILSELYSATDGPNWERNLYWLTEFPLNAWSGVATDYRDRLVVTGLYLHSNNLKGEIPSGLGGLAGLESLDLSFNNLTGPIPPELGNLTALRILELNFNNLTGPIPPELGNLDALEYLWLELNDLTGSIPPELGNLANAVVVNLWKNNLAGSIPPELGNLANLRLLRLRDNELTGSIPLEFAGLGSLESLDLHDNDLTGPIPSALGSLSRLASLDLSDNRLTGSIPPELGSLVNLGRQVCYPRPPLGVCEHSTLSLARNSLTGPIPPQLGRLTELEGLDLSGNDLTGSIPSQIGNLVNLTSLTLGGNDLTGSIPPQLSYLASLESLELFGNMLTGSIPSEIGNLVNLTSLTLGSNDLSGPMPSQLGNLVNLTELGLEANDLTGSIPPEIGSLSNLTWLALSMNSLTGTIPSELGALGRLRIMSLSDNNLTGPLPPELGGLDQLKVLYLHRNGLTGAIPQEFTNLELEEFYWSETQLCAPANQAFQTWLRSIRYHQGGATCTSGGVS